MHVQVKRGLDLALPGAPAARLLGRVAPDTVAVAAADCHGIDARPRVAAGDRVARGQPLLADRRRPDLVLTAPVSGVVVALERGARRRLERVVVSAEGDRDTRHAACSRRRIASLGAAAVRDRLLASGLWPALRARPGEMVAPPGLRPRALFVTAIDTRPLAPDPAVVLATRADDFAAGLAALAQLPGEGLYVCVAAGSPLAVDEVPGMRHVEFAGPHPAGLAGTHLHAVGVPVGREPDLWHVGYQDVAAFGRLLLSGTIDGERTVALAGPAVADPGLYRVTLGTRLAALPLPPPPVTVVSGPLLAGGPPRDYLGRYDLQVSAFPRGTAALPRGPWRAALARLLERHAGPATGMLPVEAFERIWPFRTPPAALLRALLIGDPDDAARLGCLGLADEDLALCRFVCPAGIDYPAALRHTLAGIAAQ